MSDFDALWLKELKHVIYFRIKELFEQIHFIWVLLKLLLIQKHPFSI